MIRKVLSVNSYNRISGSSDRFTINLKIPSNNSFTKCSLLMAEINKSYYMIDSTNNVFAINETAGGGGDETVTLTAGRNYTADELATEVGTQMTAATGIAATYTCTYSAITSKFTIATNDANPFVVKLTGKIDIAKYLGLDADDNPSTGVSLIAENIGSLQRYDIIQVHSSIAKNGNNDILGEIYTNTFSYLATIAYSSPDAIGSSVDMINSNDASTDFYLTDSLGRAIDLNGLDIRMQITCY